MSERFVIEVSDEIAGKLRRIAELTNQTVESLIVELLHFKPLEDMDTTIKHIARYSDFKLWVLVESVYLSSAEKAALLCTKALIELRHRGYDVAAYLQETYIKTALNEQPSTEI